MNRTTLFLTFCLSTGIMHGAEHNQPTSWLPSQETVKCYAIPTIVTIAGLAMWYYGHQISTNTTHLQNTLQEGTVHMCEKILPQHYRYGQSLKSWGQLVTLCGSTMNAVLFYASSHCAHDTTHDKKKL